MREEWYDREITPARSPSPGIAAVLSVFIPGLGQLYAGEFLSALGWFAAVSFGYWAILVPGFFLHVLCVLFAYGAARRFDGY